MPPVSLQILSPFPGNLYPFTFYLPRQSLLRCASYFPHQSLSRCIPLELSSLLSFPLFLGLTTSTVATLLCITDPLDTPTIVAVPPATIADSVYSPPNTIRLFGVDIPLSSTMNSAQRTTSTAVDMSISNPEIASLFDDIDPHTSVDSEGYLSSNLPLYVPFFTFISIGTGALITQLLSAS